MTHTTPRTPTTHTTNDMVNAINNMNRAIDKHNRHIARQRIRSLQYNSRESYDTRNAQAYIKHLWRTTHTPLVNALHHTPPRRPPLHTDYQPPEPTPPTPITPPPAYTSKQLCIVTDKTHALMVAQLRVERTDHTITIITRTRQFRVERHTPSPTDTYTYQTDTVTGAELTQIAQQYHAHIYKLI